MTAGAPRHEVQRPGSRGGHWWLDQHGHVRYGPPPAGHRGLSAALLDDALLGHAPPAARARLHATAHELVQTYPLAEQPHQLAALLAHAAAEAHEQAVWLAPSAAEREARLGQLGLWLRQAARYVAQHPLLHTPEAEAALARARAFYEQHTSLLIPPPDAPSGVLAPARQPDPATDRFLRAGQDVTDLAVRQRLKGQVVRALATRWAAQCAADPQLWEQARAFARWAGFGGAAPPRLDHPAQALGLTQGLTQYLIQQWAITAADASHTMLALQLAAHAEFGLGHPSRRALAQYASQRLAQRPDGDDFAAVQAFYAQHAPLLRSWVRLVYRHTQEHLAAAGLRRLTLYRGLRRLGALRADPTLPGPGARAVRPLAAFPLSSWSADRATAESFALQAHGPLQEDPTRREGLVLAAQVPASWVWSTARTGPGCLAELEYILLAAPGDVLVEGVGLALRRAQATSLAPLPIDADPIHHDWLRSRSWDLWPATALTLLRALGADPAAPRRARAAVARFLHQPAAQALPLRLRAALKARGLWPPEAP